MVEAKAMADKTVFYSFSGIYFIPLASTFPSGPQRSKIRRGYVPSQETSSENETQ